ncbi:Protein of unknown function (DUF732) [Mycolicibacterium rhodesiae NBB3]|jgi:hypothetical protein|uniref:DUF732 domain-containing protein n=1 Tax=Mycolicibacterium rhodesiae (strain NBB3) TaxID=710685 RepID=G8RPD4_MYCRN|nr:DUF732 domain-containing protein [Mycolicibacterium rhodesiae]AEV71300.1 Protein of unknown function (DUF732) [Mycolicibacterium rhodesiae NBB3]
MTTLRRAVTVVMVAAGLAVFGGATSAQAQDADEQFEKAVNSLGITAGDETDIPALGRNVCNTLAQELAKNPNPPPVVRGIVASLQNSNLSREQAVGFMQASVVTYCPQFTRFIGR